MLEQVKEFFGFARELEKPWREEINTLTARVNSLSKEAADAKELVTQLQKQADAHKTELAARDAKIAELEAVIAKPDGEIEKRASLRARTILAELGVKPVEGGATSGNQSELLTQLEALKASDPAGYMEFYRKNKAAIDAAYRGKK